MVERVRKCTFWVSNSTGPLYELGLWLMADQICLLHAFESIFIHENIFPESGIVSNLMKDSSNQ